MTKTEKRLVRESSSIYMGRPICFEVQGDRINLWPKNTTRIYSLPLAVVYIHAKQAGGRPRREYVNE